MPATSANAPAQTVAFTAPSTSTAQPSLVLWQEGYDFWARMCGAIELERIKQGRYVEYQGTTFHAYFKPAGTQDHQKQRRVSFLKDQQIHASVGFNMQEAQYIIALGAKLWGGVKLLSGASDDDKFKLWAAAQTHQLRTLVTQLEQGTISDGNKQRLAAYIIDPQSVPAVRFQDGTAIDGATYRPPENITRIDARSHKLVSVPVEDEILAMKQALLARAMELDPTLRPIPLVAQSVSGPKSRWFGLRTRPQATPSNAGTTSQTPQARARPRPSHDVVPA